MTQDVARWVGSCQHCLAAKTPLNRTVGIARFSRAAQHPFDIVAMDFVGPLPETPSGNKFILTWIDTFTNWAVAVPVPDTTAATLAEKLYESLFCVYGMPLHVISDRGAQFLSEMNRNLMKFLGVRQHATTSYSPNANGVCERMHRYLGDQLRTLSSSQQRHWDRHVHAIMFTFRNGRSEAHGNTPFFLMHGRDPRLPEDLITSPMEDVRLFANRARLPQLLRLRYAHDIARGIREKNTLRRTASLNQNRSEETYEVGELVFKGSPNIEKGVSKKFQQRWKGPYRVVEMVHPQVYRLKALYRPVKDEFVTVHVRRMQRIKSRECAESVIRKTVNPRQAGPEAARRIIDCDQFLQNDDVDLNEPDVHEVENLLRRRFRNGKEEYLIRWKGLDESYDTWEPVCNINQAALDDFHKGGTRRVRRANTAVGERVQARSNCPAEQEFLRHGQSGGYVTGTARTVTPRGCAVPAFPSASESRTGPTRRSCRAST
ncbi:hypothetical protein BVRB_016850 [Beta vulgaris subsp. vulgaris]|uniref:Integrase catalytic domain-containing protein n=1 Tax=Beta vulgaris subsp. vulgaris TaxID=3555 RepID=A0A0J8B449_BETVV|nr:hypothetical protein BVRB_016850 [Beta vulgaris subsp. vulgaris]